MKRWGINGDAKGANLEKKIKKIDWLENEFVWTKLTRGITSVFDHCIRLGFHRGWKTSQINYCIWTSSYADHQKAGKQNGNNGEVLHFWMIQWNLSKVLEDSVNSFEQFQSQPNDFKFWNGILTSVSRLFYTQPILIQFEKDGSRARSLRRRLGGEWVGDSSSHVFHVNKTIQIKE